MDVMFTHCAGLDVHKKTVAVCVRVPGVEGARDQHVRTFGTTGVELLALRDWPKDGHDPGGAAMQRTDRIRKHSRPPRRWPRQRYAALLVAGCA